jgi:hypothetical protein
LALKKATENKHWVLPWAQIAKGLAEYRLGNYAAARQWAEKGLADRSTVYSIVVPGNLVKALALVKLGERKEAQAALEVAKKAHAAVQQPVQGWTDGWHDWYMCEMLFREAEVVQVNVTSMNSTQNLFNDADRSLTRSNYEKIEPGMTYEDVISVLQIPENRRPADMKWVGPESDVELTWTDKDAARSITVKLKGKSITDKTQIGLK